MIKRIISLSLVTLFIFTLCGTSAYARTSSGDEVKPADSTATGNGADKHVNEKLRTDILNLIADTKSGRITPAQRPQVQNKNNLSKGTKIAIGVGVAVAVVAAIVLVKADKGPSGPIAIF